MKDHLDNACAPWYDGHINQSPRKGHEPKGAIMPESTESTTAAITATELAAALDCSPRQLRSFIRSSLGTDRYATMNGSRYEFTADDARSIRTAFLARSNAPKSQPRSADAILALLLDDDADDDA